MATVKDPKPHQRGSKVYYYDNDGQSKSRRIEFGQGPPEDSASTSGESDVESFIQVQEAKKSKKKKKKRHHHSSQRSGTSSQHLSASETEESEPRRSVLSDLSQEFRRNHRIQASYESMPPSLRSARGKRASSDADAVENTQPRTKKMSSKDQIAELQAQLAAQKKQVAELQTQVPKKTGGKSNGILVQVPLNPELLKKVQEEAGPQGKTSWRTTKFLNSDHDIEVTAKQVMRDIPDLKKLLEGDDEDQIEENIKAFLQTYESAVCSGVNDGRSNCQSGLKKAYLDRAAKGLPMPNPDQLLTVVLRKGMIFRKAPVEPKEEDHDAEEWPDIQAKYKESYDEWLEHKKEIEQNLEWFQWYWTQLLPKVAGSKRWKGSIRNYGRISDHAPPDQPNKKYITTSDEALVVVLYENCGQRFPYLASLDGEKHDPFHPQYQSAFSDAKVGQKKLGGWSLEGRARFTALMKAIRNAKRRPHVQDLESRVLRKIRKDLGKDKEEPKKRKGRVCDEFQGENIKLAEAGLESDAMSDLEDGGSDIEAFDEHYQAPQPKKPKLSKKKTKEAKDSDDDSTDSKENGKKPDEEDDDDDDDDEETGQEKAGKGKGGKKARASKK